MIETKTVDPIKEGYLEEKILVLKPSPRGTAMGITDPAHVAFFQIDQATTSFCLARKKRGDLVNIFKSDDERIWFEDNLGLNLNPTKAGNYFEKFFVKVIMDRAMIVNGEPFDMSDAMDNLRARILKASPVVAPSWEVRKNRMEYRWALIDQSKISQEAELEYDTQKEFWMLLGKHDDTPKLRSLLKMFFATIAHNKNVPADMTKQLLMKEFNLIFADEKKRKQLLVMSEDSLFQTKELIIQALEVKAITKQGENEYVFTGEEETFTFNEIAERLNEYKESDNDIYFTVKDQIEKSNK